MAASFTRVFNTARDGKLEVIQYSPRVYHVRPAGEMGTHGYVDGVGWSMQRVVARTARAAADKARPFGETYVKGKP